MRASYGPVLWLLAILALSAGCLASHRLMATYSAAPGPSLRPGTVQLLVQDRRGEDFLGPEAQAKKVFAASSDGRLDLTAKNPDGSQLLLSDLSISKLVWEAVRRNLALTGVTAITGVTNAKARVTVVVEKMSLELAGREVIAEVRLSANIDRPGLPNSYQTRGYGKASRTNLIGDQGGAAALSEALTIALNNLNFSGLDNFQ